MAFLSVDDDLFVDPVKEFQFFLGQPKEQFLMELLKSSFSDAVIGWAACSQRQVDFPAVLGVLPALQQGFLHQAFHRLRDVSLGQHAQLTMSAAVSLPGLLYRKLIIVASISESPVCFTDPLEHALMQLDNPADVGQKSVGRFA